MTVLRLCFHGAMIGEFVNVKDNRRTKTPKMYFLYMFNVCPPVHFHSSQLVLTKKMHPFLLSLGNTSVSDHITYQGLVC